MYELMADVRLTGLKSKPELNGQRGRVMGFDQAKGRYHVAMSGARNTLQVKATNLVAAGEVLVSELDAYDMLCLTLSGHDGLTPRHAERIVEMLGGTKEPFDVGRLLRCVCVVLWQVPHVKTSRGKLSVREFGSEPPSTDKGIVLCSDGERVSSVQARTPLDLPSGHKSVAKEVRGWDLFLAPRIEKLAWVSLNPELGATTAESKFFSLPAAYFPSLCHMSDALRLERSLPALKGFLALPADATTASASALQPAAQGLLKHTFFCFNAARSGKPDDVVPITTLSSQPSADGTPQHFMLLFTCEMLLEHARPHLHALGAFEAAGFAKGTPVPATAVPFSDILASLSAPGARNSGVHLNEFVPHLDHKYAALGLDTTALQRLSEVAAGGVTV